jgi:hypothetical protein
LMAWCAANRVEYLLGLAKNERLTAEIDQGRPADPFRFEVDADLYTVSNLDKRNAAVHGFKFPSTRLDQEIIAYCFRSKGIVPLTVPAPVPLPSIVHVSLSRRGKRRILVFTPIQQPKPVIGHFTCQVLRVMVRYDFGADGFGMRNVHEKPKTMVRPLWRVPPRAVPTESFST